MNELTRFRLEEGQARPAAALAERQASEREIAERIVAAVMDHRLPAGTKLGENALCQAFDTTRARVRRVLLMLSERGIVELQSNRGAFVASPTREDARNVFQARCVVEPPIIRTAVQRLSDAQIDALAEHVAQEEAAERRGDRREMIRLSGLFHVSLATFAGNPVLKRIVEDLVARSSLIIGLFGRSHMTTCSDHEHAALLDAIRARNAKEAPGMMIEHLNRIERELELGNKPEKAIDLKRVFAG